MKFFNVLIFMVFFAYSLLAEKDLVCPNIDFSLNDANLITSKDDDQEYVDENRDVKDLGTSIVVKSFFKTPDTLFNFLKLVYGNLDKVLENYRLGKNLAEHSIFLVFKGGNVLRMMANTIFEEMPPQARDLLKEKYANDFKRSDADFSVYINENKLNGLDYETTFNELTKILFDELAVIRKEFEANPAKYFSFFQYNNDYAVKELQSYLPQLSDVAAVKDPNNETWFNANFKQIQLNNIKVNPSLNCKYQGNFDYAFRVKGDDILSITASDKTDWISNSDNRTLEFPMGNMPGQVIKFSLVRSKVIFEYTYEKDGVMYRKPIGGELIDVSLPHRKDSSLANFFKDNNIVDFTVVSNEGEDEFTMKVYSTPYLAHDLHNILFDSFDRPWNGGHKYLKRLNRLMFLAITEMVGDYGLGSVDMQNYVTKINDIISLFTQSAQINNEQMLELTNSWPDMHIMNNFMISLNKLMVKLSTDAQENDKEELKGLLEVVNQAMEIAKQIANLPKASITNINQIRKVNINKIF